MGAIFFESASDWRKWLVGNHGRESEAWVGFYKRGAGTKGITYSEALDEALCFGWIDGVRKTIDKERWVIRFTPRKPRSIWSAVNLKRAEELKAAGRMAPTGLRTYEERDREKAGLYSFE